MRARRVCLFRLPLHDLSPIPLRKARQGLDVTLNLMRSMYFTLTVMEMTMNEILIFTKPLADHLLMITLWPPEGHFRHLLVAVPVSAAPDLPAKLGLSEDELYMFTPGTKGANVYRPKGAGVAAGEDGLGLMTEMSRMAASSRTPGDCESVS